MASALLHGIPRWNIKKCPILGSYKNAHGSAPVVWNFLSNRFLHANYYHLQNDNELWTLSKRDDVPRAFRQVMKMTSDRAVILNEDVPQAIADLEEFLKEFPLPSNRVNHWAQIAEDLQKHSSTGRYIAFGFCMNDCGDTAFQGEEYLKKGEIHHHKIKWKDEGFWDIYALEKKKA